MVSFICALPITSPAPLGLLTSLPFTVNEPVDWVNGDRIAVAATSFDHYET